MDELTSVIKDNEKLIYAISNNFKNYNSKEDLYQAGCLGIIKAYKNYNPNMNCKFSTYAYNYILGEMKKLVRDDKGIKISREISKLNLKIEKAYILLSQKLMKEPSIKELADYLGIDEYYVGEAINSLYRLKSIDEPVNSNESSLLLEEVIGKSDNVIDLLLLKQSLNNLKGFEKNIIEERYMNDLTQEETSKIVGISQVQVSRYEKKALNKMKEKMKVKTCA